MTTEPHRGEGGPPPGQTPPGAPPGSPHAASDDPYQQPGQPPQPYVDPAQPYAQQPQPYAQQAPQQPYAQQPQQPYAPQPYVQPAPAAEPPYDWQPPPQPGYLQGAPQQAPSPYQQPLPPPPGGPSPDPGRRPAFDGPLPDAPPDNPPLQWGAPLSAAAPAPKAPGRPKLSVLAVVSLVIGALAGLPALVAVLLEKDPGRWVLLGALAGGTGLALILGLIALIRCRGGRRRGTAFAVTGMVLAALWGAGAAYAILVNSAPEARDTTGKVVRRGDVPVTTLKVGDCIEKWSVAGSVGDVTVVPCTTNHDAEVFHTFTATGGDKFPGDTPVGSEAATQCLAKAKTALKPDDAKKAKTAFFKPVSASWGKGQKQVSCIAVMPAPLGRSVRK